MAIEQEWWKNKLAEDIYATLRLKEQSLEPFQCQSPQLCVRRHLVDWLSLIVSDLGICVSAQHLAVYLLDRFMDGLEVELCYIHLVALTCLLLAVKFEDHCERVPHYNRLNAYLHVNKFNGGQPYTAKQYLNMELNVLQFCKFDLCIPTVPHFLPYFLKVAVDEDDLRDGLPITSKAKVETYLEKHATYFQEIVLQDVTFREYAPSLVASACVAAARICVRLTPTWPTQMELMTDYYLEQLLPCVHTMLIKHQQDSQQKPVSVPPMSEVYSSFNSSFSTPIHSHLDRLHPTFSISSPEPYRSTSDLISYQQVPANIADSYSSARDFSNRHSNDAIQNNNQCNKHVRDVSVGYTDENGVAESNTFARDFSTVSSTALQSSGLYSSARNSSLHSNDLAMSIPPSNIDRHAYDRTSSATQQCYSRGSAFDVNPSIPYLRVDNLSTMATTHDYLPYDKFGAGLSRFTNQDKSASAISNSQILPGGPSYSSLVVPPVSTGPVTERVRGS